MGDKAQSKKQETTAEQKHLKEGRMLCTRAVYNSACNAGTEELFSVSRKQEGAVHESATEGQKRISKKAGISEDGVSDSDDIEQKNSY